MIDLHVHTNASDGTKAPAEVVRLAAAKGLRAIAITDHDTVEGVAEAVAEGKAVGVEVVPGVEISADFRRGILHILGYFVRTDDPALLESLGRLKQGREERTPKILSKLQRLSVDISVEEVNREAGCGVTGRPHIAKVLARKHYVSSMQEAFDRYLRRGAAAYVEKLKLPPEDALQLIIQAGGLPVVAHPHTLLNDGLAGLEEIIKDLIPLGLQGIEAFYPAHTADQTSRFLNLAKKYDLAITGGTDYHGSNKPDVELGVIPGQPPPPYELLERLKQR